MERFHGKVALVIGAASGIGLAIAARLHQEGACVLAVDCAEMIPDLGGDRFTVLRADVTSSEDCRRAVEAAVTRWGGLDLLVNSAGIGGGSTIADLDEERWDAILDVNLKGVVLACRAALPALAERGGGSIVNLASLAGLRSAPGFGPYGASKAGVIHLTRILALEAAPQKIRVNALCPAWIDTPMFHRYVEASGRPEAARRHLGTQIPLGRIGTVDDVAAAALFLASDEAAFITGVALPIDGGAMCA